MAIVYSLRIWVRIWTQCWILWSAETLSRKEGAFRCGRCFWSLWSSISIVGHPYQIIYTLMLKKKNTCCCFSWLQSAFGLLLNYKLHSPSVIFSTLFNFSPYRNLIPSSPSLLIIAYFLVISCHFSSAGQQNKTINVGFLVVEVLKSRQKCMALFPLCCFVQSYFTFVTLRGSEYRR